MLMTERTERRLPCVMVGGDKSAFKDTFVRKQYTAESIKTNTEKRTVTAAISTEAIDRDKEIMLARGADLVNYRKNPVVLWAHNYAEPPIAKALWIKRDTDSPGIIAKMQFAETDFADEVLKLYEGGFLKAFSIGFDPSESKEVDEDDVKKHPEWEGAKRVYTKWELLEFSAVPVPANPEALMSAVGKGILSAKNAEKMGVEIPESGSELEIEMPERITADALKTVADVEPEPVKRRRIFVPKTEPKPVKRRLITPVKKRLLSRAQLVGFIERALNRIRGRCD